MGLYSALRIQKKQLALAKINGEACLSQQMLSGFLGVSPCENRHMLPKPKDGGISDVLPVPEHCDKERVVTVAPVCARHVSVCPDAGR